MDTYQEWDDIIVGAGSSGSVLASRLSEQPGRRVLLIEAGPDFPRHEEMPSSLRDATTPVMSGYNWDFSANLRASGLLQGLLDSAGMLAARPGEMLAAARAAMRSPQSLARTLQQFPYPTGKVAGGSSAINGALALRPFGNDFDKWCALGNTEWSWEKVAPYFMKIEDDRDFRDSRHGCGGPVPVARPQRHEWHGLQSAFHAACEGLGLPAVEDLNGSFRSGVGAVPSNSVDGIRVSAATAYLAQARQRSNLAIHSGCTVNRLLFDGKRVVGVEVDGGDGRRRVFGGRVALCAGAINTVAILLRSGIGNSRLCRSLGVSPVADLLGVGENLADHPAVMLWMVPKPGVCVEGKPYHQVMARAASSLAQEPDLNLFMVSNVLTAQIPMLADLLRTPLAFAISVVLTGPASRGRVFLESAAPGSKPVIELNFCSAPGDMERLMQGVRLAWKIARSGPLAELTRSVFMWTDAMVGNDAVLKSAINRFIGATWHACGTARMGPEFDPLAVVDQYCRVHGVDNLRVVDASVMPAIPGTSTNLTCMMLAERVADWMKEEA